MATKPKGAGPASKGLSVVARAQQFCRAGLRFGPEATVVPLNELSEEQAEAIRGEPMLVVAEVDIEPTK